MNLERPLLIEAAFSVFFCLFLSIPVYCFRRDKGGWISLLLILGPSDFPFDRDGVSSRLSVINLKGK